jgi:hypothetical protein
MIIDKPRDFFEKLGNLHDARIERLKWLPKQQLLYISIDDLNSNFFGSTEYVGAQSGEILLSAVKKFYMDIEQTEEHLNIYDFAVKQSKDIFLEVEIKCSPGGSLKISCASISWEKL